MAPHGYSGPVSTGRELHGQVACYGCGVLFNSHSKTYAYCSDLCSLLHRALRMFRPPRCPVCSVQLGITHPETGALLTRDEYWQAHDDFQTKHRTCLRDALDRDLGDMRLACRCKACRRARGEFLPQGTIRARRVKEHASKTSGPSVGRRKIVLERDGWVCQICGLPLDPNASVIDDLYPHVDHVLPVALGGDDDLGNLRAAHRWCNLALSDSLMDGEVRKAARIRYASRTPPVMPEDSEQSLDP